MAVEQQKTDIVEARQVLKQTKVARLFTAWRNIKPNNIKLDQAGKVVAQQRQFYMQKEFFGKMVDCLASNLRSKIFIKERETRLL